MQRRAPLYLARSGVQAKSIPQRAKIWWKSCPLGWHVGGGMSHLLGLLGYMKVHAISGQ